jgi:hypothetical protein
MSLFQWENIDHSLVSLKLTDLAEKMHSEIRLEEERIRFENRHNLNDNAVPSLVLRMKQERADECARKAYEIYCGVWQTQGHVKSGAFVRVVCSRGIVPMLRARAGAIAGEFSRFAERTSFPDKIRDAHLVAHGLKMQRLQSRWERQLEAEAKECEHAERTKNSSSNATSETRPTSLSSDETLNGPRTPDSHSPADRKTPTSLNYRSELKRAVALLLIKDPNVSDLNICRGLDADGAVELPQSLTGDGQRRLFIAAYKDPRHRHRLETTFSRVRRNMRDKGLLKKKAGS